MPRFQSVMCCHPAHLYAHTTHHMQARVLYTACLVYVLWVLSQTLPCETQGAAADSWVWAKHTRAQGGSAVGSGQTGTHLLQHRIKESHFTLPPKNATRHTQASGAVAQLLQYWFVLLVWDQATIGLYPCYLPACPQSNASPISTHTYARLHSCLTALP